MFFSDLEQSVPSIDFHGPGERLKTKGAPRQVVHELVVFFELLGKGSLDELIDGYSALKVLGNTWGRAFQYLCFTKNDFVSDQAFQKR